VSVPTAADAPPRLVLRFALYSAIALLIASLGILWFVRHEAQQSAEREVGQRARLVASGLTQELRPSDFSGPVTGQRRSGLDGLFRERLMGGLVRIKLWSRDGTVTYSNEHSLIGTQEADVDDLARALRGETVQEVGRLSDEGEVESDLKVLEAYVPMYIEGSRQPAGVLEVYQDYGPVAAEVRSILLPIALALGLALLALWATLLPILRQVTRALETRTHRLADQTRALQQTLRQREEAETNLREAEAGYQALVEQLPLAIYIRGLNVRTSNTYVSPQVEPMLGYPAEQWRTDPDLIKTVIHPDDLDRVLAELAEVRRTGEPLRTEYRCIASDGRIVWVEDLTFVVRDDHGKPQYVQGFLLDITARKNAQEAREQLAAIVESSDDAIISADLNGLITSWNAGAERVYGYRPEEILGRSISVLAPQDRSEEPIELLEGLKEGRGIAHHEGVRVRKGGRRIDVSLSLSPIRDSSGNIIGASAITRDITARKKAERELERLLALEREQNERLLELDKLKDEFVALVSHELRTPLTSIRGYLELVLDGEAGDLTDEQRQFLGVVERNADRLLALVGDLLFLAQVEAGKLTLEVGAVDVAALAAQSVEAAQPLAEDKNITLTLAAGPVPLLAGDNARISQLIDNLITNALKFTPEKGHVDVRAHPLDGSAVIEVRDSGIGIPAEEQERLFERFFRSSNATERQIQGTGLGLAISKAIVDAHGGHISVDSELNAGTTFRVSLPIHQPQAAEPEREPVALQ
jgi:PAS domain S-box-containing protein